MRWLGMFSRLLIYRMVAVVILLLAGVELIACEVLSPATCEIAGAPGDGGSSRPADGDDCLCCCFHIVVSAQITLTPTFDTARAIVLAQFDPPSAEAPHIYHPPRV